MKENAVRDLQRAEGFRFMRRKAELYEPGIEAYVPELDPEVVLLSRISAGFPPNAISEAEALPEGHYQVFVFRSEIYVTPVAG